MVFSGSLVTGCTWSLPHYITQVNTFDITSSLPTARRKENDSYKVACAICLFAGALRSWYVMYIMYITDVHKHASYCIILYIPVFFHTLGI